MTKTPFTIRSLENRFVLKPAKWQSITKFFIVLNEQLEKL